MGKIKILFIILARKGSKGISNKNFRKINGKPLFQYILEAALEAKIKINSNFDVEIVVSSDDKNIIDHANSIQADIAPFRRPIRYSKDDSLSIDAMKHALEYMEKDKKIKYDQICLLQPTSPLCEPEDILNCIYSLNSEKEFVSAVTICESSIHPFKMKRLLNNNVLVNYLDQGFEDMRPRQSLPRVYKRNGAVYLSKRSVILDEVSILGDPCLGVEVPITRSIDIDNEADFKLAEILIKEKHQI